MSQKKEISTVSLGGRSSTDMVGLLERSSGRQVGHPEQAKPVVQLLDGEQERETTVLLPSSPLTAVRPLLLIPVLVVVTLGMILSLIYLSSAKESVQTFSMDALPIRLPPLHILLIVALIGLSVYALIVRAERPGSVLTNKREQQKFSSQPISLTDPQGLRDAQYQAHIELLLIRIWARVLGLSIEQIRGTSDFFLSGGDSDSLNILLSEIEQQFHLRLDPDDVFDHPVLYRLAAVLVKRQYEAKGTKQGGYL